MFLKWESTNMDDFEGEAFQPIDAIPHAGDSPETWPRIVW